MRTKNLNQRRDPELVIKKQMKDISVHALYEGTYSVGTDKIFLPIEKTDPPKKGALKLSIHPFLIKEQNRNILFDAGIGDLFGGTTSIETIKENLSEYSVSEYDITDIFISHLHFDHFAGLANRESGYWELTFPDAAIWISKQGWESLQKKLDNETEDKQDFVNFLDAMADIRLLTDQSESIPHIRTKTTGGHTEFHQALFYENGDHKYMMAGDVIGRRSAINRNFAAKYDYDPKKSMQIRTELANFAHENDYVILAYHESDHPVFRLTNVDNKKAYKIENLS